MMEYGGSLFKSVLSRNVAIMADWLGGSDEDLKESLDGQTDAEILEATHENPDAEAWFEAPGMNDEDKIYALRELRYLVSSSEDVK